LVLLGANFYEVQPEQYQNIGQIEEKQEH